MGYLALGIGLPLVEGGAAGREQALRTVDTLAVTGAVCLGLKALTREQRPDGSGHDSFPSWHAAAAFGVATVQSQYHPKQAPLWFGGAVLISASRVAEHRHYVHDAIGGAALGYFAARLELARLHGFVIFPFLDRSGKGVQVSRAF